MDDKNTKLILDSMNNNFRQVYEKLGSHDEKFEQINNHLKAHDENFKQIYKRFDAQDDKFDKRFNVQDDKFDKRFDAQDDKFEEIKSELTSLGNTVTRMETSIGEKAQLRIRICFWSHETL